MKGLKRVSIQGEPYPVFFGMYGFARIMTKTGLKLHEVLQKTQEFADVTNITGENLMFLYDFMYAGFVTGSKVEKVEFPYSVEELSAYLSLTGKQVETVFEAFMETMPQLEEVDQKKVTAKPQKVKGKK